ncbi:hypothetical protein ACP4OV_006794 [Aristida adscensionis]
MASCFLSTTSLLLPVRRRSPATAASLPCHLKPRRRRLPPRSLLPPRCCSSSFSCKSPAAWRAFPFLLAASLLALSGLRPLPSRAQEVKEAEQAEEEEVTERQDEEEDEYSAILRGEPGDVGALKCALYGRMRRADWGGALRYARRLRGAEPREVEWRLMEALLHELRGDLAAAERAFRELLAEEPLHVRALHGLALCMHKRDEGHAVFDMLENALRLANSEKRVPVERNIKLLIAQMHVAMGQLDVASEKLQNLINEDPRDFRPHLCQGIVYALLDKKQDADVQFDIYRSLVPDEFPDKSFINDVIHAARMESQDRLQKEVWI